MMYTRASYAYDVHESYRLVMIKLCLPLNLCYYALWVRQDMPPTSVYSVSVYTCTLSLVSTDALASSNSFTISTCPWLVASIREDRPDYKMHVYKMTCSAYATIDLCKETMHVCKQLNCTVICHTRCVHSSTSAQCERSLATTAEWPVSQANIKGDHPL